MDLHYTRNENGSYYYTIGWWNADTGEDAYLDPESWQRRDSMVTALCGCIALTNPKQVRVFIDGSDTPHMLNHRTVSDIHGGRRRPSDLTFGRSPLTATHRMMAVATHWYVLRSIPGSDLYECPVCGRGAELEGSHLHCSRCGSTLSCLARFEGFCCADLSDMLERYPDQDRFFIDRVWNESPPWISRGALTNALKQYADTVQTLPEE